MNVLLMSPTVLKHDAVGNDIEAMYRIITTVSPCKVFAEGRINKHVEYIDDQLLDAWLNDIETVIIYHHSIYWQQGEELLKRAKGKIMFKYHNITPSVYFRDFFQYYTDLCELGRNQTERLQLLFPEALWMADSMYNAQDLVYTHPSKIEICPPFHRIETIDQRQMDVKVFDDIKNGNDINLLFVGRVAPNKGHLQLLDILHNISINLTSNVKLRIIGKFDENLRGYNQMIKDKIGEFRLKKHVEFIGEINENSLVSYYKASDFFVCTSEHEGFCVPVIEAQYFGLPVLTISSTAIDETLGEQQLILDKDVRQFTAAIELLTKNRQYRDFLIEMGHVNFNQRFRVKTIESQFQRILTSHVGIVFHDAH
jgi:glycosyltransferase involved in cell wall biosynthesis